MTLNAGCRIQRTVTGAFETPDRARGAAERVRMAMAKSRALRDQRAIDSGRLLLRVLDPIAVATWLRGDRVESL